MQRCRPRVCVPRSRFWLFGVSSVGMCVWVIFNVLVDREYVVGMFSVMLVAPLGSVVCLEFVVVVGTWLRSGACSVLVAR